MDKDKSLDMALVQIERQYGKGAVMRLGDHAQRLQIDAIPTGSIALDIALGIGGFPRGRVVECFGPESSGKCLVADTSIWTDRGLETVAEIFERCGERTSCTSRVTDIRDVGLRIVNERGELEPVVALTHNNRRPVVRLRLRSGRTVTVTHNHPLRVMDPSGFIVWRNAGDIAVGDTVVSATFGAAEAAEGDGLSVDEAVLIGYLVAEGSLSNRQALRFTNRDPEVGGEFTRLMEQLFGSTVRCYDDKEYAVHDTALRKQFAERYGLDYVTAHAKCVPHAIRTGGAKVQKAFLSALFEGDGSIDPSSTIGLGTASETLARDVQLLLYGFGIPATVSSKFNAKYDRDYWSVTVNPASAHRFLDEIGFRSARRRAQVDACFRGSTRDPQFENIPNIAGLIRTLRDDCGVDRAFDRAAGDLFREDMDLGCSRGRLTCILEWVDAREGDLPNSGAAIASYLRGLAGSHYTYECVDAVEDAGRQPTFDLVVPGTHSFLANGVLSHNTTVCLHVVAEAQKAGGVAAFIDAEHALDPAYAKNIGVDIDALLVSQPDTGEQALEIADMLIRSGAIDILVIDSVAALVPRAEIEGEMGDSHVGLQARLMSQALRKLTASVSKSSTCVVFINQLREKIGVMFGSPETTPGGRALKFYSSVRLDVRRVDSIKDGAEIIGNKVKAKVVKNKCLAEGSLVFDPTTGVTHTIEDIVDSGEGSSVFAVDKVGKLNVRPILRRFDQGEQVVVGLTFREGTLLWATPDHRVLTDRGWREVRELRRGDQVARPRRAGGFGTEKPVPPDHARLLGYLIGDGYVGGKTPVAFINTQASLQEDAIAIASELGCGARRDGTETSFSHRKGEKNGVLELARWAGIWGHLAPEKRIPAPFFAADVSEEIVANLLFGIWESDGWISREQTGGVRCGFVTTSEQLAHQIHWLLLRWGIGSSMRLHVPGSRRSVIAGRPVVGKLPCWQVRVSGIDNIVRFSDAIPMWGPRGQILTAELQRPEMKKHRGSQRVYLPSSQTEPVLAYLDEMGVTPKLAQQLIGPGAGDPRSGLRVVLGVGRLRRDRLSKLAEALDSDFLRAVLDEDVFYDRVWSVTGPERRRTFDIEVEELHSFVANDVVVHNCAPPFRTCEFDIVYGKGISKEGSLLDVAVEAGIVKKSGAWFTFDGEQLGQGRENAKSFLASNTDITAEIERLVRKHLSPNGERDADVPDVEEELEPSEV